MVRIALREAAAGAGFGAAARGGASDAANETRRRLHVVLDETCRRALERRVRSVWYLSSNTPEVFRRQEREFAPSDHQRRR